jgi:CBS domain-containing protein
METMTREKSAAAGEIHRSLADHRTLTVGMIMTRDVVTTAPNETICSAAEKMREGRVSSIVVVDKKHVRGIFTERDIVRNLAACGVDLGRMKVSERMSSPVETIQAHIPVLEVSRIMGSKGIKRLPVVADRELIGIVTQTDITRGLIMLSPLRSVRDVMSHDVAAVDADATVAKAIRIMSQRNISCVVARRGDKPVGILTEKDLANSIVAVQKNPADVRVCDVMSSPILGIPTTSCVHHANQKMSTRRIHRLAVLDGDRIRGIVTQSDIMRAIQGEFEQAETDRETVMAAIAGRVRSAMNELTQLQDFVHRSSRSAKGKDTTGSKSKELPLMLEITARVGHVISELAQL